MTKQRKNQDSRPRLRLLPGIEVLLNFFQKIAGSRGARVLFITQTSIAGMKLYFLASPSLVKHQRALPAAGVQGARSTPDGVSGAKPLTISVSIKIKPSILDGGAQALLFCVAKQYYGRSVLERPFFSLMVRAQRAKGFAGSARTRPLLKKGDENFTF